MVEKKRCEGNHEANIRRSLEFQAKQFCNSGRSLRRTLTESKPSEQLHATIAQTSARRRPPSAAVANVDQDETLVRARG